MKTNQMLQAACIATSLLVALPSYAARDFTPQAGTWIVSSELDGKPGRGLAIDVQGNTFFMQVFGYEKNGDATFYTATGQMDGNGVTAPLMRYQGGRSFGSGARDAVEDKTVGDVAVSFSNGLKGTVQFPGEQPVAIERFLVSNGWEGGRDAAEERNFYLVSTDSSGTFSQFWYAVMLSANGDFFRLGLRGATDSTVMQTMPCTIDKATQYFHCEAAPGDPARWLAAGLAPIERVDVRQVGESMTGSLVIQGAAEPYAALGSLRYVNWSAPQPFPSGRLVQSYSYARAGGAVITGPVSADLLMPMNGTWIVEGEQTGKPGRGISLDMQNWALVMQMFNYRADGQPTFHMGSGSYLGNARNASTGAIALKQYAGGRSLGGGRQSAHEVADAGDATVSFSMQPDAYDVVGTVQLPGEAPQRIKRLTLEPTAVWTDRVLGQWYFPQQHLVAQFSTAGHDELVSDDGRVTCRPVYSVLSQPVQLLCSADGGLAWRWSVPGVAQWLGRDALASTLTPYLRLRDRHGNVLGLGQVDE